MASAPPDTTGLGARQGTPPPLERSLGRGEVLPHTCLGHPPAPQLILAGAQHHFFWRRGRHRAPSGRVTCLP